MDFMIFRHIRKMRVATMFVKGSFICWGYIPIAISVNQKVKII